MSTYYRYKRPITNIIKNGTVSTETKTFTHSDDIDVMREAVFDNTNECIFALEESSGDIYDFSEFVSEMQVVHNDIDGEDAGRCKHSGKMKRDYITNKHTLNIKLINKLSQTMVHRIFSKIYTSPDRLSLRVWYQSPCQDNITAKDFYCSTINFGAQRYDRYSQKPFFDGMNFNLIEI